MIADKEQNENDEFDCGYRATRIAVALGEDAKGRIR